MVSSCGYSSGQTAGTQFKLVLNSPIQLFNRKLFAFNDCQKACCFNGEVQVFVAGNAILNKE